jgi:hypothetical protein
MKAKLTPFFFCLMNKINDLGATTLRRVTHSITTLVNDTLKNKKKNFKTLNKYTLDINHRYLRKIDCSSFMCPLQALALPRVFLWW